jgi:hypothetical protein
MSTGRLLSRDEFKQRVFARDGGKCVFFIRRDHAQTDRHWTQGEIERNLMMTQDDGKQDDKDLNF